MKNEIYRALFLTLGTFQIISNMTYLLKKDGILLARKQHTELPISVTDKQMKVKVVLMLLFGIAFFGVSIFSYMTKMFWENTFKVTLVVFAIYALSEAFSYRYWKTFGFGVVSLSLLIVYLVF